MEHSDVLSIAINGTQRELMDARSEVVRLEQVLEELQELDNEHSKAMEDADFIGRPAGFTPEPLINHNRIVKPEDA